jgi:hypothetical protein
MGGRELKQSELIGQGCTNPGRQVAVTIEFCAVAPYIYASSVWNVLHFTLLGRRITWFLDVYYPLCTPLRRGLHGITLHTSRQRIH